jgi:hypothetical protein
MLISPNHIKVLAAKYLNIRCAAILGSLWHSRYNDLLEDLDAWRLNHFLVYALEVMNVPDLTRLRHTTPVLKSLPTVVGYRI